MYGRAGGYLEAGRHSFVSPIRVWWPKSNGGLGDLLMAWKLGVLVADLSPSEKLPRFKLNADNSGESFSLVVRVGMFGHTCFRDLGRFLSYVILARL